MLTGDLDQLQARGVIARYELTGRQIIVYLRGLRGGSTVAVPYRLKARFPLRARTPSSP